MVTYPGLPAPAISDWLSRDASSSRYAPGTTFQIGKIEMLANTGTYIDAPFHRYDGRQDIGDYPLESVADLEGVVIRATERKGRALDAAWFGGHDVRGKAVLVHTGWDAHWRTERYGSGHPFLTRDAVEHLVSAGAALVGIDSLNIDDATDGTRPVHTILLGADRYETDADRAANRAANRPDLLIGEGTVIERAILDKECRIGRNVKIVNHKGARDDEGDTYVIRDGIVCIPRGTVIPDGTVI